MQGFLKICVLFSLVIASNAYTASFDCNKAKTASESIICSNPELSLLDNEYSALFSKATDDTTKTGKVTKDTVAALNWREANCRDKECLQEWYRDRISSLQGTMASTPQLTAGDPTAIGDPTDLFRKLNIRTFESSLTPQLKSHCGSYFSDLYPESAFRQISSDSIEVSHDSIVFTLKMIGQQTIKIDERITNGSYNSSTTLDLKYFPEPDEWRANKSDIPLQKSCIPVLASSPSVSSNSTPPKPKVLNPASKKPTTTGRGLEDKSIGEFSLTNLSTNKSSAQTTAYDHHISSMLVYKNVAGDPLGTLHLTLLRNPVQGTRAMIKILSEQNDLLPGPTVIYRTKHSPSLLLFEQENNWYNLSSDTEFPAWVNLSTKNPELEASFRSRLQVVADASEIKVHSAHKMRTGPNTNSDVLLVLNTDENDALYPIKVEGDWLKIHYVSPSAGSSYDKKFLATLDDTYTQYQGWIKWRKAPGDEYIDVLYNIK